MLPVIIAIAAFVGVAALVFGVTLLFRGPTDDAVAERLDVLAGMKKGPSAEEKNSLLAGPLDDVPGALEQFLSRVGNLRLWLEQADLSITPANFIMITLGLAGAGALLVAIAIGSVLLAPLGAIGLGILPLIWLWFARKRRLSAFAKQLPESLELISRALRAGHSLGAGFQLCGDEMSDPIGSEFTRVFEEQNLGVPLEEALQGMTERVPNLDLKFFATAVVLQRQTGGDLAEILDKIGTLIRERFKIYGQIQALTGEGRLSGVVLLALPPVLFVVMLRLNPDYVMVLFTDPLGRTLLGFAGIMQILGALVIRKIVNIKV
ncbi:MAG: type II secretion system F family protein [Planctomycetales bacterium]|nr:type II secretion system F family protein [Planctomycetales bacterium]